MCFIAGITWQTNCYCNLHSHKFALVENLNNLRGLFRIPSEKKVCVLCAFFNLQVSTRGTWGCRSADGLSHTSQPILSARDNHRHQRWAHSSSQIRSQHWSETRTGRMPTFTLINTTFLTIIWQTMKGCRGTIFAITPAYKIVNHLLNFDCVNVCSLLYLVEC